ncbi:MAG: hypothetical protein GPJ54_09910 [Candidatus Heimdallarchaeota archaeon]|nr:hypothetical protein [Candidatus Heimdallarchaeota archaeon]
MRKSTLSIWLLLMLAFGGYTPAEAQESQINQLIGVENNQIFTYQITNILNFQNVPLFVGENGEEIKTELGDVIRLKVIDVDLSDNAEIELEIQLNDGQTIEYFNKMDTFDLVVFTDWEYWKDLAINFNILFDESDEFFEIQFAFADDGLIYSLLTIYDKVSGVFVYQLIYVTLEGFFDTPIAFIEIVQGDPLPIPDKSEVNVSLTDFYQFELTQLVGYEDNVVMSGTDGELFGEEGDIIEILVANGELGQNRELLLAVKNGEQAISYLNRMDFLGSIYDIPFFVFTDWDYMIDLINYYGNESSDIQDVGYDLTVDTFVYYEEYANESEVYYNIELHYDLDTGVLLFEAFYFENLTTSQISIIEINNLSSVEVDKSLINAIEETDFLFRVEEFEVNELQPVFTTSDGNVWLFEGDIFEIILNDVRDSENLARMQLNSLTQTIKFNNSLASLGEFAVYPDWVYWDKYVDFIKDFSDNTTEITSTQTAETYIFSVTIQDNMTNYNYSTVYEKTTGVMKKLKVNYEVVDDNETQYLNLLVERYDGPRPNFSEDLNQTLVTLDTITPSSKNSEDDISAFGLFGLLLGLIVIKMTTSKFKRT